MGRSVLLVQPSLQPPGGGNGVAAWFLQALVREHRVTVLSWLPVDVRAINRFFGTSLEPADFETILVPRSWTAVPVHFPVPAPLPKFPLPRGFPKGGGRAPDVVVGAANEADLGRRGIQSVHSPTYLRPRPAVDMRPYHRPRALLQSYYRV